MAAARSLCQLPDELQLALLGKLDAATLVAAAATCRSMRRLTDIAAQSACGRNGCHQKGAWSAKLSWRVIFCGRSFRSGMRLRRFIGKGNTRRSGGLFQQPTAIAALPGGTAVVCNALSRMLAIVSLDPGELLATLDVDGAPCGVCYLQTHKSASVDGAARFSFAVSVQGLSASGERLDGVRNTSHRVEVFLFDPAGKELTCLYSRLQPSADGPGLSFPNGLCLLPCPTEPLSTHQAHSIGKVWLACADWNNHRVAFLSTVDDNTVITALQTDVAMATRALQRPADCTILADGTTLAIIGYYSDSVLLVDLFLTDEQRPGGSRAETAASPRDAAAFMHAQLGAGAEFMVRAVGRVCRRRCGGGLQRPSGLCVEPTSGRLLVAESGAQRISVYSVGAQRDSAGRALAYTSHHVCDICVEQLGTGLHLPHRGEWSWLAVDCTESLFPWSRTLSIGPTVQAAGCVGLTYGALRAWSTANVQAQCEHERMQ